MHLVPLLVRAAFAQGPGGVAEGDSAWGAGLEASAAFPWVPVLLIAGPATIAIGLCWWYVQTARRIRQAQLAPPVWLLPYLEQKMDTQPPWPPAVATPEAADEQIERTESLDRLARRKRAILLGLALNFVAGWAMAGVYLYESRRGSDFQEFPPTASLAASVDTLGYTGLEEQSAPPPALPAPVVPVPPAESLVGPVDTAAQRRRAEQRLAFFRRRDSLLEVRRLDSLAAAQREAQRLRDSIAAAVRDSIAQAVRLAAPPAVAAPPPPPPPPPPAPAPPPPDPRVELARATEVVRGGANDLVARIGTGEGLSGLLAPGPAREGFLRFVQQNRPAASLVSVADPMLTGDRASGTITVQFQWRGTFGDTRRRTARFQGGAVREGSAWRVTPFTVLDNLP